MPSFQSTAVTLLIILFIVTPGCALKHGGGMDSAGSASPLVRQSLPTESEGLDPDDLTPLIQRGWDALRISRFDRAATLFGQAVSDSSLPARSMAAAHSGLGFARAGLSLSSEAGDAFTESLALVDGYGPALLGRAVLLRLQDRPDESLAGYERLSGLYPESAMIKLEQEAARVEAVQLLVRRGKAVAQSDPEQAADSFRRAVDLDPLIPQLHGLLAGALEALGRYPETIAELDQALAIADEDEQVLFRRRLAELELEHGSPARAMAHYTLLLEADPGSAELAEGLVLAEERFRLASLPEPYHQMLAGERQLDRGGLATMISMTCGWDRDPAPEPVGKPRVIRDISSHWAGTHIRVVVDQGVMEVHQNHTFRPATSVTRGELASTACRLLRPDAGMPSPGEGDVVLADLSRDHRQYDCVQRLVRMGLLKTFPDRTVRINALAGGAESLELITAIHRLNQNQ